MRSTESSHVHRVHSLKSCFLCVQSLHAVNWFLVPITSTAPKHKRVCNTNTSMWLEHRVKEAQANKHFLGLSQSNFPSCAMGKSGVQAPCYHIGDFFFWRVLPQRLSKFWRRLYLSLFSYWFIQGKMWMEGVSDFFRWPWALCGSFSEWRIQWNYTTLLLLLCYGDSFMNLKGASFHPTQKDICSAYTNRDSFYPNIHFPLPLLFL